MGAVYIVFDHVQQCPLAIKTIRPDLFEAGPRVLDRFRGEAIAWVQLDRHPNIVEAAGFQELEGVPCLILEYVDGGDLSAEIQNGRLVDQAERLVKLGIQFCDGMVHANRRGVAVHRDVKPSNCLLTNLGRLKVSDFGLAKVWDTIEESESGGGSRSHEAASRALTMTGAGMGTLPYMAPEQFVDAKHVDARADIYSFGVMLFEMATGGLPFHGRSWDEYESAHTHGTPPHLPRSLSDIDALVQCCLEKGPERRPGNFGEVRRALADVLLARSGEIVIAPAERLNHDVSELLAKADSLRALGRHEQAVAAYRDAVSRDPRCTAALDGLLAELSRLGRNTEVIDVAAEASQRAFDDPEVLVRCGRAMSRAGAADAAHRLLARAHLLTKGADGSST